MDWNEVKAKPKKAKKKVEKEDESYFGGNVHGHLTSGPIKGSGTGGPKLAVNK